MKAKDIIITSLICLFFFTLFCIFILKSCETSSTIRSDWDKEANSYYSKYNIVLKGVIEDKVPIDSHYCTYIIKILKCNVKEHDVRPYNENYYLIVKDDLARMVDGVYCGQVNDSIFIDYKKNYKLIWNSKRRFEEELRVFSPMYNDFRKQGLGF